MYFYSEHYQLALGDELRKLRKRRGLTRKELNQSLQSEISLQTLATYELGTRQCSVVRLAEICLAMGEQPHEVLARVDKRVFAGASGEVQINLDKIAGSTNQELLPLRRWAEDRLQAEGPAATRDIVLNMAAVERMAELCGLSANELLARLRELAGTTPNSHGVEAARSWPPTR
ncbi:MAG: helix-turn-helix domain-containing protein [Actinophytocola sp.]|nr:helix-turn-helix domain-containing protein [Actinophytocola sp.]